MILNNQPIQPPQECLSYEMDLNSLQTADIILTRASGFGGFAITAGTQSNYAHAMVYIGRHNNQHHIVDAMPPPKGEDAAIRRLPLREALRDVDRASVRRHRRSNTASRQLVRQYLLRRFEQGGSISYDTDSIFGPWNIIDGTYDRITGNDRWAEDAINAGPGTVGAVHCSELVVRAYQYASLEIEHPRLDDEGQASQPSPELYSPGTLERSTSLASVGLLAIREICNPLRA